jgi:hypothetical protein
MRGLSYYMCVQAYWLSLLPFSFDVWPH